jgi:hypothetical protein
MSEYISGEQLYKMLHVSKRKMKYLIKNGYIPCEIQDSKTWCYRIQRNIAEQICKTLVANPDYYRLPVGLFNSNASRARKNINFSLKPSHLVAFKLWLTERYSAYPGALTMAQATELSYLSPNFILVRIHEKEIFASQIGTNYVISKKSIIEYISSERMLESFAVNGQFRTLVEKYFI